MSKKIKEKQKDEMIEIMVDLIKKATDLKMLMAQGDDLLERLDRVTGLNFLLTRQGYCIKCGDKIKGGEDSICGRCATGL